MHFRRRKVKTETQKSPVLLRRLLKPLSRPQNLQSILPS